MSSRVVVLIAVVGLTTASGVSAARPRTRIVTWNPFTSAGAVKPSLALKRAGGGDCIHGPSSEAVGDLGYRCHSGSVGADPCWRDGPRPTDLVVCPPNPWGREALLIRVPHFMLAAGVTYAAPIDVRTEPPWAIETALGDRCLLAQGAHDLVTLRNGHRLVVDYLCDRKNVVLLRDLRRGRVWRIGSARWMPLQQPSKHCRGSAGAGCYVLLGDTTVRSAIFPSLPPPTKRQNRTARAAAAASGLRLAQVLRVRLNLPGEDWAYVEALAPATSKAPSVWTLVHRSRRIWAKVRVPPTCRDRQLPVGVRHQLLGCGLPRSTRAQLDGD